MSPRRFPPERFISSLERQLITLFDSALLAMYRLPIPDGGPSGAYPRPEFSGDDWMLQGFFDRMQFAAPEGFIVGARVAFEGLEERGAGRALTSLVLTRIARKIYESPYDPDRIPQESEVAFMGRFLSRSLDLRTKEVLEWFEDMHDGNDVCGLLAQPVQIPRGVLLSPEFPHASAGEFWELAAASPRFPERVFSAPCVPEDGELFSPFQCRRFGEMFAVMPEAALERFVPYMAREARIRLVRVTDDEGKLHLREEPLGAARRTALFRSVLFHVADDRRRGTVHELLLPASGPDDDRVVPVPLRKRRLDVVDV